MLLQLLRFWGLLAQQGSYLLPLLSAPPRLETSYRLHSAGGVGSRGTTVRCLFCFYALVLVFAAHDNQGGVVLLHRGIIRWGKHTAAVFALLGFHVTLLRVPTTNTPYGTCSCSKIGKVRVQAQTKRRLLGKHRIQKTGDSESANFRLSITSTSSKCMSERRITRRYTINILCVPSTRTSISGSPGRPALCSPASS